MFGLVSHPRAELCVSDVEGDVIRVYYFIVSGEISAYLVKIKVVSITSELISYHFTSD